MEIDIKKLVEDLKNNIAENMKIGDQCDVCKQHENLLDIPSNYCVGCGIADCETFSEKYRTYRMCHAWYTDTWLEHAFSDLGADLSPADYGFIEYYGDEITERQKGELNEAMEKHCLRYEID